MANGETPLRFGPFLLHPVQGLRRDNREIRVTPRSLDLLNCLAAHPGEIIGKEELFRSVWHNRVVTDAALTSCIRELRQALGDDARRPRYIETVHRRGYRLIATPGLQPVPGQITSSRTNHVASENDHLLENLKELADAARRGHTVTAVLTGGSGFGKTTLVQSFLASLSQAPDPWRICTTACNDNAGPGDAYRPLLELLTQLIEYHGDTRTILTEHAPSWLVELPRPLTSREARLLGHQTSGTTSMQRNRELLSALAALAAAAPLVLVVEDAQHCDAATADCLRYLARNSQAAMLVIITCRWEAVPASSALRGLGDPSTWTRLDLDAPKEGELPSIDQRLGEISDDARRLLEAASIAGKRFSTAEAAAGTGADIDLEEADSLLVGVCQRTQVIRPGPKVRWPDGTSTSTFDFERDLDRDAILGAVPVPRRAMLHRRVGGRLEAAYKTEPGDIAAQLAAHFEMSGDYDRALAHHYAAGVVARRRSAPEVASKHFRSALALIQSLPSTKQRDLQEADLLVAIGRELIISEGLNSDAASDCYRRAMELQEGVEDGPILSRTLWGLWVYCLNCGPLKNAQRVAERLLELAQACGDPDELLQAHHALWGTSLMLGNVNAVLEHARKGIALCATEADAPLKLTTGCMFHDVHLHDHGAAVCAGFMSAWADVLAGRKDMAAQSLNAAISHARDVGRPFNLAVTLVLAASAMAAANDPGMTRRFAEEGRTIAEFESFGLLIAWASIYEGWALARLGDEVKGLDRILDGLEIGREVGMTLFRPFQLALAADVQLASGKLDDASRSLEEALHISELRGDRLAVPELYRLRGELRMRTASSTALRRSAVSDLCTARDIATELGATLMAARASASLQRLQARQSMR